MRTNKNPSSRLMACLSVTSLVAFMLNSVVAAPSEPLSERPSSVLPSSGLVSKSYRARAQNAPSPMMQMPMVFPLFIQNQDFTSAVVLTNAASQSTYADVTLTRTDGREITHHRVQFAPHSQSTVDIQSLLMSAVSPTTTGSITVTQSPDFDGTMVILGQLSMTYRASEQATYIDEEIAMPNMEGSQTLRAVSDPGEGSPLVAVTNLSEAGQRIAIRCLTERKENFSKSVDLLAGETLLTEPCSERTIHGAVIESFSTRESEGPHGPVGISLTTDGMPGSIAAFGLQPHKKGHHNFFSNVTFTDPKMLMSPATVFDGVPVGPANLLSAGNYVPELSLTNFSTKALKVAVQYSQTSGATPAIEQLAAFSLPAGSTKKVTFDDIQGDPQLQNSFLVTSTGAPGDVLAKLVSKNDSAPDEVELLGKDAQDMNNGGSNPWSIEGGSESTLLFFNHDQAPQIFNVLITSEDGTQWDKDFKLAPMETRAISIGDIVQKGLKDDKSKTLPQTAVSGQISWWTVGTASGPGTGRLLQSNRALGITRSFACGCPYILCGTRFFDNIINLLIGDTGNPLDSVTATICLYKTGTHCGGSTTSNSSSQALSYSWSSSNSAILQISGSSANSSVNVTGASTGTATMTGQISATYFQPSQTCMFGSGGNNTVFSVTVTSADIVADKIAVTMAPSTLNGTLTLTVNGPGISFTLFQGLEQGNSINFSFNRPQLPSGQYTYVQASWNIPGSGTATSTANDSFDVLGLYRHSQYNTPYESTCTGTAGTAWVITGSCNFTQTTLKSDFMSQLFINGSGVSLSNGSLHYYTQCSNYPAGANSQNSFLQVSQITGSCNTVPQGGITVAVFPNPPVSYPTWECGDLLQYVTSSDTNQVQKSVQDYCPGCNTGFNGTAGHIDDYSSSTACSGHNVGDYGNFLTIRLR
jgi:hypothetical protein